MRKFIVLQMLLVQAVVAQNLLDNGNFDLGLTGWGSSWSPEWISDDGANSGNGCMQSTHTGINGGGTIAIWHNNWLITIPTKNYLLKSAFKLPQGSELFAVQALLSWFTVDESFIGADIINYSGASYPLDTWLTLEGMVTAPENAIKLAINFEVVRNTGGQTATTVIRWDDMQFMQFEDEIFANGFE